MLQLKNAWANLAKTWYVGSLPWSFCHLSNLCRYPASAQHIFSCILENTWVADPELEILGNWHGWILEMQNLGPAARPGLKFGPSRASCGAQTKSAGLMPRSEKVITMYYALGAGLRAVLERCWPGSMLGAQQISCGAGLSSVLRFGFWRNFCISRGYTYITFLIKK